MSTPPSSVHHPPPSDAPDSDDTPADSSLFDELIERTGGGATMALERRGEEVMPLHLAFGREVGKKRKRKRRDGEFDGGKKRRKGEKGKGRRKRERIELKKLLLRLNKPAQTSPPSFSSPSTRSSFHRSTSPSPADIPFPCSNDRSPPADVPLPIVDSPALLSTDFRPSSPLDPPAAPRSLAPHPRSSTTRSVSLPPDRPAPFPDPNARPVSAQGLTRITPSLPPLPAPPPPTSAMAFTKRARLLSAARGGEVKGFDEEKEELGRRFEGAMRRFDELLGRSSRHFALTSAPIKRYADGELKQRAEAATAGLSALRGYFAGGEEKKAEKEL